MNTGSTMNRHPAAQELARAAEGLLEPTAAAGLDQHVNGCAECQDRRAGLQRVSLLLADVPAPVLPAALADQLNAVLRREQQRRERPAPQTEGATVATAARNRTGDGPYGSAGRPHPSLGRFGADLRKVSAGRRWGVPVLAAAVAAAVVGCGTYVLSASLGLNEPPSASVALSSGQLGAQASALRQRVDLQPHRFSQAWWCARRVVDAPIVGLASIRADGEPAVLVYTRAGADTRVTVVTGCDRGDPQAGPSVLVGG